MWHRGYDVWWMGMMMIVFWGSVIALAIWAIRSRSEAPTRDDQSRRSLSVLEERYARGEIDDDEFLRRRRLLAESTSET